MEYDASAGIICTAFRLKSTVVMQVFGKPEFYFLFVLHSGIAYAFKAGYYDPSLWNLELAMGLTGITGSLMTFFVVFYNGNVFARYNKLYELTKNMNESCLYAVSIISREISDKNLVRKLTRMLLASAFLFFFERTESSDDGNISAREWNQLKNLGLLNDEETELLKDHCKKLGRHCSMPSFMLIQWSMRLYRKKSARLGELEKTYWMIRRCQDDVVELMELPMPFQYFHIMNLMMMLNLTLWAYSLALEPSYFASIIFMFVQLVFQGIRELSVALSDPYGDDEADFPLDDWMTQLYVRLAALVEDPYQVDKHSPFTHVAKLKKLAAGSMVIDLLIDKEAEGDRRRKETKLAAGADNASSEGEESDTPPPSDKAGTGGTGKRTKGEYQELSQKEDEEEEEEDDD